MAFPVVATRTTTQNSSNVTSHNANLPASIDSGDLLLMIMVFDESTSTVTLDDTTAGTWATLRNVSSGGLIRMLIRWKAADGTEDGKTMVIGTANAQQSASIICRITGWHGTSAPELASLATTTSTTIDPPSLTASWGAEENLWIALGLYAVATGSLTDFPDNFVDTLDLQTNAGDSGGVGVGYCTKNDAVATLDPATFTISASQRWESDTLVIRPAAGGGATGQPITKRHGGVPHMRRNAGVWAPANDKFYARRASGLLVPNHLKEAA